MDEIKLLTKVYLKENYFNISNFLEPMKTWEEFQEHCNKLKKT